MEKLRAPAGLTYRGKWTARAPFHAPRLSPRAGHGDGQPRRTSSRAFARPCSSVTQEYQPRVRCLTVWTNSAQPGCMLAPSFYSCAGLTEVCCKPQGRKGGGSLDTWQQEMNHLPGPGGRGCCYPDSSSGWPPLCPSQPPQCRGLLPEVTQVARKNNGQS